MQDTKLPIVRPEGVTVDWLTDVLHIAGHDVRVKEMTATKVGTGQVGETMRFDLTFVGDPRGAPATIVGKFPSPDEESRATGVNLGNYFREVRFYRDLADKALITTPVCLHADVDAETSEFVLMMEDLSPAVQGDQLKGLTLEQAYLAVEEVAKLHASHWGRDELDKVHWLHESKAAQDMGKAMSRDLMGQLWAGFRERYADDVPEDYFEIGDAIVRNYDFYRYGYEGPRCLTHNDYRPDNMMFGTAEGGYPLAVVDWQSIGFGCGLSDVSYMLSGALPREELRKHERQLLEHYHATLTKLGVSGFSLDEAWEGYVRYAFSLFIMAFAASMIVERTERGDKMFLAMLRGGAEHVKDLNALSALSS